MIIDYEEWEMQSKTVCFFGATDDGKEFVITANWNIWDGWNVTPDDISFTEDDGTDEECQQIANQFLYDIEN